MCRDKIRITITTEDNAKKKFNYNNKESHCCHIDAHLILVVIKLIITSTFYSVYRIVHMLSTCTNRSALFKFAQLVSKLNLNLGNWLFYDDYDTGGDQVDD